MEGLKALLVLFAAVILILGIDCEAGKNSFIHMSITTEVKRYFPYAKGSYFLFTIQHVQITIRRIIGKDAHLIAPD